MSATRTGCQPGAGTLRSVTRLSEEEVLRDFEERTRAILGTSSPEVADGRVALRLRNREKVVEALVELVSEGKVGTIDEIVERSGIARRSIFRHFSDLSELLLAGMRSVLTRSTPLSTLEDPGVGPLEHRIDTFVDARLRTLAIWHPFRSGVNGRVADLDVVKAGVRATTAMLLEQIARHFAQELERLPPAEVEQRVHAVYIIASYESYDILVGQLGRPVDMVRATWTSAITSLLHIDEAS
jgi:AcrR family transcriptional regulator